MNDGNVEQSKASVQTSDNPPTPESVVSQDASSSDKPAITAEPAASPSVKAPAPKTGAGFFRRFFWLDHRVKEAAEKGFAKDQPGWTQFELARQARSGIVQIGETGEGNGAVLLLERAEVLFLLCAHLKKHKLGTIGMSVSSADWELARKIPAIAETWSELSGAQQEAVLSGLGDQGELSLVDLDIKHRRHLASALRKLATGLADPLERDASIVGRVLFMRWTRIVSALLVLLAIAWSIWGAIDKKFASPNIALGRPVTISSQFGDIATDHTLLVDGDKTNLGFHTDNGANQWVMIDLGATKNISKVVVYNRSECCQDRAIPLRLEVSEDGTNFSKVQDRTEEFDVWTAKGLNAKGRYVRLRHLGSNFLHFSEVEVY